jgi:hypothetical protein
MTSLDPFGGLFLFEPPERACAREVFWFFWQLAQFLIEIFVQNANRQIPKSMVLYICQGGKDENSDCQE